MRSIFLKYLLAAAIAIHSFPADSTAQNTQLLDSLKRKFDRTKDDSIRYELLNLIARHTLDLSDKMDFSKEALDLAKELNYARGVGQSYMRIAQVHRKMGNLPESIENILAALKTYEEVDYQPGIATVHNTLGTIYASQEDYQKSIDYLLKALNISESLLDSTSSKDLKKLAGYYNNLGEVYRLSSKYDSANYYFMRALELHNSIENRVGSAYALGNIGLVYASLNQDKLAEKHISEASTILETLGDRYPIAVYNTYMADIYKNKGDTRKALDYANTSYKIAQEEGLRGQIRDASLKISEMYEALEDYRNAHYYQSQYILYRDSINNEKTIRQMADLRTEYEVSKKQIEVDLLNQEAAAQRFIVFSLAIILLLAIALAYVLYRGYTLKVKSHRMLAAQKSAIKSQRDELTILNKTKDRFFSIISHDLRGPVGTFQGTSQLIRILVDNNETKELLKVSDELDRSTKHLASLLDNLLYWALSQQGKFPYSPEQTQLYELVESTVNVLEKMASVKGIHMTINVSRNLYVFVDRNSILTVIRNLLNNALKFTPSGGVVTLNAKSHEDFVQLIIEDEGVGIPKNKMESLFTFKGKRSEWGTDGEKGIGLGLTLTHEFVVMNKGTIKVDSIEGIGTKFFVNLPTQIIS